MIVTVSGIVMLAATSAGELKTTSVNPEAAAAAVTASMMAAAKVVPEDASANASTTLAHSSPHWTTYEICMVVPAPAWARRR